MHHFATAAVTSSSVLRSESDGVPKWCGAAMRGRGEGTIRFFFCSVDAILSHLFLGLLLFVFLRFSLSFLIDSKVGFLRCLCTPWPVHRPLLLLQGVYKVRHRQASRPLFTPLPRYMLATQVTHRRNAGPRRTEPLLSTTATVSHGQKRRSEPFGSKRSRKRRSARRRQQRSDSRPRRRSGQR